jgi:hypothetical protein
MKRTYRTIDADGHVTEPPDLCQQHTDPVFRDRAPHVFTDADGTERVCRKTLRSTRGTPGRHPDRRCTSFFL